MCKTNTMTEKRSRQARRQGAAFALALLVAAGCSSTTTHWLFKAPPKSGNPFPDLAFNSLPAGAAAALGLPADVDSFSLSQLDGQLAIVMVTDLYCRYCQKAAPQAVRLYRLLQERQPDGNVRMLAIALANSEFEANLYREKYSIPFPVMPDPDSQLRTAMGKVGTPAFFAVRLGTGTPRTVSKQDGQFESDQDMTDFLESSLKAVDLAAVDERDRLLRANAGPTLCSACHTSLPEAFSPLP